jgi:hypothetical protein
MFDQAVVAGWAATVREEPLPAGDRDLVEEIGRWSGWCVPRGPGRRGWATFDAAQRAAQAQPRGVPAAQRGRGVAEEVGLARRESPPRGRLHRGLAKVLDTELPCTAAAFAAGRITEWRAMSIPGRLPGAGGPACGGPRDRR